MPIDDAMKVMDGVTKLLAVILWPAILVFVLIRFRAAIAEFFADVVEFTLKGGGVEASVKLRQAEAAAALGAATASRPESAALSVDMSQEMRATAELVTDVVTPRAIRRAGKATVLWVDDNPRNNAHERHALEALGVTFVLGNSTEEAMELVQRQPIDLIISDMGRPRDPHAGYTLLERLRADGNRIPFIIYAGSAAPEHRDEARRRGALGCTNRPDELFEMVLAGLGRLDRSHRSDF